MVMCESQFMISVLSDSVGVQARLAYGKRSAWGFTVMTT